MAKFNIVISLVRKDETTDVLGFNFSKNKETGHLVIFRWLVGGGGCRNLSSNQKIENILLQ
jgi:hypothetical protein